MRHRRALAPWARNSDSVKPAAYHCVSRVVGREFLLTSRAKEYFSKLIRLYERFTGVRVLAHCCMSNHFHLLLEVPSRAELELSDQELLERLRLLYSEVAVGEIAARLVKLRALEQATGRVGAAEEYRETFLRRMHDLSEFMKVVKQRMTAFVNREHQRKGTLWEERFKSVLVESGHACRVMAAYIDLNPVRASLVKMPEDYRWSSYGEVCSGHKEAQEGLARVMARSAGDKTSDGKPLRSLSWKDSARHYRRFLVADAEEKRAADSGSDEQKRRQGVSEEITREIQKRKGQMSRIELLRCRVRHFTQGVVLGRPDFVEGVFQETKELYPPTRKTGARKITGATTSGLCTLRQLGRPQGPSDHSSLP